MAFEHRYLKNVVTLEYDETKCTGCGLCLDVCPHGVFRLESEKAVVVDRDACIECGACVLNCPFSALRVRSGVGCAAAVLKGKACGETACCGGPSDSE